MFGLSLHPTLEMIPSKKEWQGCDPNAVGVGLIKQNVHKAPTKRQRGVAVNFRGV